MSSSTYDNAAHEAPVYTGSGDPEKGNNLKISRVVTPGGHPADFSQPAFPVQHRKFGNPTPLGLVAFGAAFFLTGLVTLHAEGVESLQVLFPLLLFFGGITQTFVGWFELFLGNTYAGTLFATYGAWHLSFSALNLQQFGVLAAYPSPEVLMKAVGLFNFTWFVITSLFVLASLRTSVALLITLVFTDVVFLAFGINGFTLSNGSRLAAGSFAIIASFGAFYVAMAGFWTADTTYPWLRLPVGDLSPKDA